jgi:hypothetical protein
VLSSPRALQVNVAIMRAFVRLREALSPHHELAHKLVELERRVENHDTGIQSLFDAIRQLMNPESGEEKKEMGFHMREDAPPYRVGKTPKRKSTKAND